MSVQSAADEPVRKAALAVGFLAVAASVRAARASPATGYEVSIYAMTPTAVWAGLLVALAVALSVAFAPSSGRSAARSSAVGLGGLAVFVFAAVPILRGYRFFGHHDSLTHLGWARGISEGSIDPFELFYPGIHTSAVAIESVLAIPLERAMYVVVLVAMLVFCVFVPLTAWRITESRLAVVVAAFSAFLLLPITTIAMYLSPHAMSQAVFYATLLVYLFVATRRTDRGRATVTAAGLAFAVAAVAAVVFHPQLLAHLIVAFLGIAVVQFLARRVAPDGRIAGHSSVYGTVLFLTGLFLVWTANFGFFGETIAYFLSWVVEFVLSGGGMPGGSVQTQGTSLAAVGGSVLGLFFKLFAAHLVFSVLAGLLGLSALVAGRSGWLERVRPESIYFSAALVALVPVFFAYFFAPGSSMYFRVFGLMMVFVTLLGAIALYGLAARLSGEARDRDGNAVSSHRAFAVVFAALLVLSLAAVFPSPYTYTGSPHVSDATLRGYESAFEVREPDTDFVGLRNGPDRFDDAVNGNRERSWVHYDVPASTLREGVSEEYDEDRYLVLTRMDYEREVIAYHGLRYTAADLDAVESQPDVDRIQSNGEFDLYYVHDRPPDD